MTKLKSWIRRFLGVEDAVWHYHIDVLVGEERRFLSGFLLCRDQSPTEEPLETWVIFDHNGLLGERDERVSGHLPLREAMLQALATLREIIGPPIFPVWNTAPYELLGYRRGSSPRRASADSRQLPVSGEEEPAPGGQVGPDGLPEAEIQ